MKRRIFQNGYLVAIAVFVMAIGVTSVRAQSAVDLRFTPADTTVDPGATGRMSILINNSDKDVRTIDVYATYDTTVVASLGGGAGTLFTNSGFFVFQDLVEAVPGQWHGFAVIMGAASSVMGAGELFYWDFRGVAPGRSPIVAISVAVAASDGTYYPMVNLSPTSVMVASPAGVAGEVTRPAARMRLWPNPFNPRTTVLVETSHPGPASLAVYDLAGRKVVTLFDGAVMGGQFQVNWEGTDHDGVRVPTGIYLMSLVTPAGTTTMKAVLVK